MLSASDLAAMQAVATAAMDKTLTITRPGTPTRSATGGAVTTPTTIATSVPARVRPGQTKVVEIAGKLAAVIPYQIALPVGTDVQAGDQLSVEGRTLVVDERLDPRSYSTTTNIVCLEVRYL